jgi:hypothetical protein
MRHTIRTKLLSTSALFLLAISASAWEPEPPYFIVNVGPDGVDSPTCGATADGIAKCRSIGQGIRNAKSGGTVNVFPGVYGDLNNNGVIGEPGEESGGPDCNCMIHVDKPVSILSKYGADSVLIEASTTDLTAIRIDASDVDIGYRDRGFTISASADMKTAAITADRWVSARVWDNSIHTGYGGIWGHDLAVFGNEISGAVGGPAIGVSGNARVAGNTILSSEEGITIGSGYIVGNVVVGGFYAIDIMDAHFAQVTHNYIVNNHYAGVTVGIAQDEMDVNVVISDNNIIENGFANGEFCGIRNISGGWVWAARNFWGSDNSGNKNGACDAADGSKTITTNPHLEPDEFPSY